MRKIREPVGVLHAFKINWDFVLKEKLICVEYNWLLSKWSVEAYVNWQLCLFCCFLVLHSVTWLGWAGMARIRSELLTHCCLQSRAVLMDTCIAWWSWCTELCLSHASTAQSSVCWDAGGQADGNGDCLPGWFAGSAATAFDCLFMDLRCKYAHQLL